MVKAPFTHLKFPGPPQKTATFLRYIPALMTDRLSPSHQDLSDHRPAQNVDALNDMFTLWQKNNTSLWKMEHL